MNIILLGMPGSGKGTQSALLKEKYHLTYFTAGDLARRLAKKDFRIRRIVDSGKLIPVDEMTKYVESYLEKYAPDGNNIIFEGYPRFAKQYESLKKWLGKKGQKIGLVIFLKISEEEAVRRLSARRICERCSKVYNLITNPPPGGKCSCGGKLIQREDDKPESIRVRFSAFIKNTKEVVNLAEDDGILLTVDGTGPIEAISAKIIKKIEKYA